MQIPRRRIEFVNVLIEVPDYITAEDLGAAYEMDEVGDHIQTALFKIGDDHLRSAIVRSILEDPNEGEIDPRELQEDAREIEGMTAPPSVELRLETILDDVDASIGDYFEDPSEHESEYLDEEYPESDEVADRDEEWPVSVDQDGEPVFSDDFEE